MRTVEYALIDKHTGKIVNVVMTMHTLEEVRAEFSFYDVKLLDECADSQLQDYRFWNERP